MLLQSKYFFNLCNIIVKTILVNIDTVLPQATDKPNKIP